MNLDLIKLKEQILSLPEVKEINETFDREIKIQKEAKKNNQNYVVTAKDPITSKEVDEWINLINDLDHKDKLRQDYVLSWFQRTLNVDRERLKWHIVRAGGFGGSEMSGLVDSLHGKRNFRNTAKKIISGKLFITPPTASEPAMERGNIMEDFAQERFEAKLSQLGKRWKRLEDIQKNVIEDMPNEKYPSIRSSLDGLYEVDGEVWIVDFKCPSTDVMNEYKTIGNNIAAKSSILKSASDSQGQFFVPNTKNRKKIKYHSHLPFEDYMYQLHHYLVDAECKEVKIDRTVLAVFDYQQGADSVIIEIERDEQMIKDVIEAADFYWKNYVSKGEVPPPDVNEYARAQNMPENVKLAIEEFTNSKILEKEFTTKSAVSKKILEDWFTESAGFLEDTILQLDSVEMKAKVEFNEDLTVNRLYELGYTEEEVSRMRLPGNYDTKNLKEFFHDTVVNLEDFMDGVYKQDKTKMVKAFDDLKLLKEQVPQKKLGKLDSEKVEEALLSCNEDPNVYKEEVLSTALTRKKDPNLDSRRGILSDFINEIADGVSNRLEQEFKNENKLAP
jgi:hypothetical protein